MEQYNTFKVKYSLAKSVCRVKKCTVFSLISLQEVTTSITKTFYLKSKYKIYNYKTPNCSMNFKHAQG